MHFTTRATSMHYYIDGKPEPQIGTEKQQELFNQVQTIQLVIYGHTHA